MYKNSFETRLFRNDGPNENSVLAQIALLIRKNDSRVVWYMEIGGLRVLYRVVRLGVFYGVVCLIPAYMF